MNSNNNVLSTVEIGNNNNKKEVKFLSIIFRTQDGGGSIMIQCKSDDKMEDAINKFCSKAYLKKEDYKFIFNGKRVIFDSTVEENGLIDNSNILVVKKSQSEISQSIEANNNNQDIKNNNSMLGEPIQLFFETNSGSKLVINIGINNTVREAEYKFCEKLDIPTSTLKYFKFLNNGRELNPDMKISDSELKNWDVIYVLETGGIMGA